MHTNKILERDTAIRAQCRTDTYTRMERIGTISEISLEFSMLVENCFKYQETREMVQGLRQLGMSYRQIGLAIGVDDKTMRKACVFGMREAWDTHVLSD